MAVGFGSMRDARDAEDALLLEQGDCDLLVAAYAEVVVQRCLIAAGDDGRDVAQDVFARLLGELRRGKRYSVPFRVVVHKVIDWTLKEHWAGKPSTLPLPDDWEPSANDDGYNTVEEEHDLEQLIADLPERARRVLELRYLDGLEVPEIADELGIEPNAVHQALHRGHEKLRELAHAA